MGEVPVGKFGFLKEESVQVIKKNLAWIGLAIVLFVFGIYWVPSIIRKDFYMDYLSADLAYHRWEGMKDQTLERLQKIMSQHPELHAKYDGAIAQKLLSANEHQLAERYARSNWKRVDHSFPYYTTFSSCSLMIEEGLYQEALDRSRQLQLQLEGDQQFWSQPQKGVRYGSILYAFNLLRIAILEEIAGSPEGEQVAWSTVRKYFFHQMDPFFSSEFCDREALSLIQENFDNQAATLIDYIEHREGIVKNLISQRNKQT